MKKLFKISIITGLIFLVIGLVFLVFFINNIMGINAIKFDKQKLISSVSECVVYDINNNELNSITNNKKVVSIEDLPQNLINAFVSIEDKQFFKHKGLNYKRMAKALVNNIKHLRFVEGASTISQQLIKNTHLSSEKTITRKLKEILLTKKLEKTFSKKDILEVYLNVIYFGENSYGVEKASKTYFDKSAKDLSLAECATLAGIIKSPLKYSPIHNNKNCLDRRNLVLKEMLKDEKITTFQYNEAIQEELKLNIKNEENSIDNLYIKACLNEATHLLNITEKELTMGNYKIYSYFDLEKQKSLFNSTNNLDNYHVNAYGNISDSLMILIDNKTFGISGFYGKSKYNLTNFVRQPGSAIKPILVYAPAIEQGLINPSSKILDEQIDINGYSPNNVGGTFNGYVSVEKSIAKSLNIPAVKILDEVGVESAKNFANKCGITFDENDDGLALALGGFTTGVTLKDLTNSFIPFANNGKYSKAHFINKIVDGNGKTVFEHTNKEFVVMGEDTACLMTEMLKKACKTGTSSRLKSLDFDIAGKTGTVAVKGTNNNTDAYSIAYTTEHTLGAWFGNYSNDDKFNLEGKNNGGTYATSAIKQVLLEIYDKYKPADFALSNKCEYVEIDAKEYEDNNKIKLCGANCPDRYKLKILVSSRFKPTHVSSLFENIEINNFDVVLNKNKAIISFEAKDYLKYDIFRIYNGKSKLINSISNKDGLIEYVDKNLDYDKKYGYYIVAKTISENTSAYTETIEVITDNFNNVYNSIIQNNSSAESWIFR